MIRSPAELLLALEQECLAADVSIKKLDWAGCERSWRAQRKLTHELEISMRSVEPGSDEAKIARARIDRLRRYRDGQLKKLQAFNANVAKRLLTIGKYRNFAKSRGAIERPSTFLDINS